jgi:hypothetical protein
MMAAVAAAFGIRRDEDERLPPVLERLGGHDRRSRGEAPQASILPGVDEAADRLVVRDRRASAREGQSPAGALPAAPDGPGGRRAAPFAAGAAEPWQRAEAGAADLPAGEPAPDAVLRKEEVEKDRGHLSTVRPPETAQARCGAIVTSPTRRGTVPQRDCPRTVPGLSPRR